MKAKLLCALIAAVALLEACSGEHTAAVPAPDATSALDRTRGAVTRASNVTVLFSYDAQFAGTPTIVAARPDGKVYGTTSLTQSSSGTVFQCTLAGACRTLVAFNFQTQGSPFAVPVFGTDGNLYGVTFNGGGTFYRLTLGGTLTILHDFNGTDGSFALDLSPFRDGNFYGVSDQGGDKGFGNVFRAKPDGTVTNLVSCALTTCLHPQGLTVGRDGVIYGAAGGDSGFRNDGFIFKLSSTFALVKLASFNGTGAEEPGSLTQGTDRNFYGLASGEGQVSPAFFRMTPAGKLTIVAVYPKLFTPFSGRLVLGPDGNFYGWQFGNINNNGRIFRITPAGVLTTVAAFDGADGIHPISLTLGRDGDLYASTENGGANGGGTFVRVTLP